MADLSSDSSSEQNEIDYLHPDGKPPNDDSLTDDPVHSKPSLRCQRMAEQEADGHYMPKDDPILHGDG